MIGDEILRFAKELYPIKRSLTGSGVRKTLDYIKQLLPELALLEVPSGSSAFDWTIPDEWDISEAFIEDSA